MLKFINLSILIAFFLISGTSFAELNSGLVAYYPFNGDANDESVNANDGTVYGGATLAIDRFENTDASYSFDGNDDYIMLPRTSTLSPSEFTLSTWVLLSSYNISYTNCGYVVYSTYNTVDYGGLIFYISDTGKTSIRLHNGIRYGGENGNRDLKGDQIISLNQWTHIAATFNGSELKTYLNGNNDGYKLLDNEYLYLAYSDSGYGSPKIGKSSWTSENYLENSFHGKIDDIRIYNRALSENEVMELYLNNNQNCTINDFDNDGVPNQWDNCDNTPENYLTDRYGCHSDLRYTEEDMMNMVNNLLKWDTNKDKQIGLIEALQILRESSGIIKEPQK